jgi:hypothetical protein
MSQEVKVIEGAAREGAAAAQGLGIWVDGPPPRTSAQAEALARKVKDLGVVRASLFLPARSGEHWRSAWAPARVIEATALLRGLGVEVLWCVWPVATALALRGLRGEMEAIWREGLRASVDPAAIDLDLEGGASGWGAPGLGLVEALRAAVGASVEAPARVNCIPPLRGLRAQDRAVALAPWVDRVALQTYSQWRADKAWTHHDLMRPGAFQRHGAQLAARLNADRAAASLAPVGVSLSLILGSQDHPAPHPQGVDALTAALAAARALGATTDLWSLRAATGRAAAWVRAQAEEAADGA